MGWFFLVLAIFTYGFANFLQAAAVTGTTPQGGQTSMKRLLRRPSYLAGVGSQFLGFVFSFLARGSLPLFLVQSSVAAGLGITALLGVVILGWRLAKMETVLLVVLSAGLIMLVLSSESSVSKDLNVFEIAVLAFSVLVFAALGWESRNLRGSQGSVVLGALAGLCFGATAVASRPLAHVDSLWALVASPLLYIMLVHALTGQVMLAMAMDKGSTTAAVAAMDAATAIPAAAVGLLLLGDRIAPGRNGIAALGFVLTLGAVLLLSRYAKTQHSHRHQPARRVE